MNAQLRPGMSQPRLGFLGVGWIGRQRMQVLADSGVANVAAIADARQEVAVAAATGMPNAIVAASLDELLDLDLDGVVIATPSGAHAAQAISALQRKVAVFCQKPLTRTAGEARQVIAEARKSDRLLAVDFSYRHVAGVAALRERVQSGEMGELQAIDLTFHNAYGPDKPWFHDLAQSGGGCVMDLGIHLVDLAQWIGGTADLDSVVAHLSARGRPLACPLAEVGEFASVQWRRERRYAMNVSAAMLMASAPIRIGRMTPGASAWPVTYGACTTAASDIGRTSRAGSR